MSLAVLRPEWRVRERICAAVTLRDGGSSAPPFDSLNLATHVGDAVEAVARNRGLLRTALSLPAEPLWLQQVHGNEVYHAGGELPATPPVADAAVTRRSDVVLAIMVADCLPVLLTDRRGEVIAAAHAGWRGLAAGVLEATVRAMEAPPAAISAWLGPAISPPHFEVGDEVRDAFITQDAGSDSAFVRNARGRWQCDLPALARRRLLAMGVASIDDCRLCTYEQPERLYSYRRDGQTGRIAALLWLRP